MWRHGGLSTLRPSTSPPRFVDQRAEFLELTEVATPGRIHHAPHAAGHGLRRGEPVADSLRRRIVIAGDDLCVPAFGEEFEAVGALAEVPLHDRDVLGQSF